MRTRVANDFFVSGGTLPPGSASYVERGSDAALFDALRVGRYCYVLNTRQMGKSSLSVRTMAQLEALSFRTVFLDLTQIGGRNVTPDQWYTGLCGEVGRALGLRSEFLAYCKENSSVSPMQRFFGGLKEVILRKIDAPVVVFVDEIDATKNLSFNTDEFFAGIRECFNRRVHEPDLKRLTFCLLGVAVPSDLISNAATTPFNIGERIQLQDFTLGELQKFAEALGPGGSLLLDRVHYWTNGQPFLTQSLCQSISADENIKEPADVDALVFEKFFGPKARDTNINLADVGNRVLNSGANESDPDHFKADILSAYERIWKGGNFKDDESNRVAVILKLSGIVRSDGSKLRVRNRIYHHVFDQAWVRENMPGQELRRQEQSFRRGIIRATAAAAALVGIVSVLGIYAWSSQQEAVAAKKALDYELYVADMNTMRLLEESGDIARMEEVLARGQKSPHRSFEWGFWMARLHDAGEEYALDYSAPGKRETGFLSADEKQICLQDALLGTASVIDRESKKILLTRKLRAGEVVQATSKGLVAVTISSGVVTVRNFLTGEMVATFRAGTEFTALQPKAQSDFAVSETNLADGARRMAVWDVTTGRRRFERVSVMGGAGFVAVSNDGSRLVLNERADVGPPAAAVLDCVSGKVVDSVSLEKDLELVDFSETGRYLLYQDRQRTLHCRDTTTGKTLFQRKWTTEIPQKTYLARDESYLVHLFSNGMMQVCDLLTGAELSIRRNVWAVSVGRGNTLVASSSTVRVLDARESAGAKVIGRAYKVAREKPGALRIFRDHPAILDKVDDPSLKPISTYPVPERPRGMTYNGKWVAVADPTGAGGEIRSVDDELKPLRFDSLPGNFAAGTRGEAIAVWRDSTGVMEGMSVRTGKKLWERKYTFGPSGMWIDPSGRYLFVTSQDTQLDVLDAGTGNVIKQMAPHNIRITNVIFPNDDQFFTCGEDGRAILWDLDTRTKQVEFRGNAVQRMSGADLSPDRKRAATCSFAGAWQLWDVATGSQLMDMRTSSLALRTIVFTSDGRKLLTAGEDNILRLWSTLEADPSIKLPINPEFTKGLKN